MHAKTFLAGIPTLEVWISRSSASAGCYDATARAPRERVASSSGFDVSMNDRFGSKPVRLRRRKCFPVCPR